MGSARWMRGVVIGAVGLGGAGCRHDGAAAPPRGPNVAPAASAAPAAAAAPAVPCPTGAALAALARTAWDAATAQELEPTCVPARMGQDVWVVSGLARDVPGDDGETNERHTAIVAAEPGGAVLARLAETDLSWQEVDYGELPSYAAHDLDGDGVDELLTTFRSSRHGELIEQLAVTRRAGAELEVGAPIVLGYDDDAAAPEPPGPTSCGATVAVIAAPAGRGRLIELTAAPATGDPAVAQASCPPPGVTRYAVTGVTLAPVR